MGSDDDSTIKIIFDLSNSLKINQIHVCIFFSNENFSIMETSLYVYGYRREKICRRGFRPRKTQTNLLSYRDYLYLRNKETQQTLRVIVNIQYDASF